MILSLYVDDIASAYDDTDRIEWQEIKQLFFEKYKIKFLGEADWLLNMRITRDRSNRLLWLDQQSYVESMLEEFGLDESRAVAHPGTPEELTLNGCPSTPEEVSKMKRIPYRRIIGLLTYLANTSRPDIAHAVNIAAQFSQNPGEIHWRAVQHILRYLCGTTKYALLFTAEHNTISSMSKYGASMTHSSTVSQHFLNSNSSNSFSSSPPQIITPSDPTFHLIVHTDANWGQCKDTRRSHTGWCMHLGSCLIDWEVQKQHTVAHSSCEAEYMAISSGARGIQWVQQLLAELGLINYRASSYVSSSDSSSSSSSSPSSSYASSSSFHSSSPIPLILCDNKSAIQMSTNDVQHKRSKHIDIKYHSIRELIERRQITISWVQSGEQLADIFTKTLLPRLFIKFRDQLVYIVQKRENESK